MLWNVAPLFTCVTAATNGPVNPTYTSLCKLLL